MEASKSFVGAICQKVEQNVQSMFTVKDDGGYEIMEIIIEDHAILICSRDEKSAAQLSGALEKSKSLLAFRGSHYINAKHFTSDELKALLFLIATKVTAIASWEEL